MQLVLLYIRGKLYLYIYTFELLVKVLSYILTLSKIFVKNLLGQLVVLKTVDIRKSCEFTHMLILKSPKCYVLYHNTSKLTEKM